MKQLAALMTAAIAALILGFGAPAQAQGIDVVFKIDESGSMGGEINSVKSNVITIFNALPPGSSVGVVGYGSSRHGPSGQIPHVHTPVTSDAPTLQAGVNQLAAGGSVEQGYRAVYESATDTVSGGSLQFTGAPYCNILITDETPNQGGKTRQEAIDAMNAVGGIFFGVLPSGLFTEAQPLADATGGQLFNLASFQSNATAVIDAVLAACVEAAMPIEADIKPGSCPNPFKIKQKGVTPVALLGSEDFDVISIIPESVKLEGDCPALRWSIEDVATPYDGGFSEPPNENECTTDRADGFLDLTLKFDSQCVAMQQGVVTESEVRLWTITGEYVNEAGDVVEFSSQDVVRVMP